MTLLSGRAPNASAAGGTRPWAAWAWLVVIVAGGMLAGWIPAPAAGEALLSPQAGHWLGTDMLGRDFGWRLMAGGVRTLVIASGSAALSILLGGVWGIAAGFTGGRLDRLLMRLMDVALSIPALVLALVVLAALGPGEPAVALAVGVGGAATFARLARAEAARIRNREFLLASRTLGAGPVRQIVRHLLPNIAAPMGAYGALHFGWAVVNASSLTFLGFGGSPSAPEWGRMLAESRLVFGQAPYQAAGPGLALALTVLAVQRAGEWWLERNRR
jgi:peptide/nickel transport system permease protein